MAAYCAGCLTESIFTQADSWEELRHHVLEAVNAFYFDGGACQYSASSRPR